MTHHSFSSIRPVRSGATPCADPFHPFESRKAGFVSRCLLIALVALASCVEAGSPDGETSADPLAFGHPDSVLLWTDAEKRVGFPRYDRIFPTRRIEAGSPPRPLVAADPRTDMAPAGWPPDSFDARAFLAEHHQVGLIVVHDGRVLVEAYADGHGPDQPWVSYSVAKSVVSLLVGAALHDGYIRDLDDSVTTYVPLLRGGAYEGVSVRDVLTMSSGVAWNEDYGDPESDVSREVDYGGVERLRFLSDRERVAEPGVRFNYSTGEIFLAGAVVRGAVGNNLSEYLEQEIWRPYGMEADATWMLVEPGGPEYAGCCISATLRDYARIGTFVLDGGVTPDGERVLPKGWMQASTRPSPSNPGYGYLWWLHEDGSFSARGIFGQLIHVDPALELVVAMHGLWPDPASDLLAERRDRFLDEVKASLRGEAVAP